MKKKTYEDKVSKRNAYARYGVPEYWIIDLSNFTLEQYLLDRDRYELTEVYADDDIILSPTVPYASFSLNGIVQSLPVQPDLLD